MLIEWMDRSSWEGDVILRQAVISNLILLKLAVWEMILADVKWEATRKRHNANCGRYVRTKITEQRQMAVNDTNSARRKNCADHPFDHFLTDDSAFEWVAKFQTLDLNSCAYKNFKYCPTALKSDSSQAYTFKPLKRICRFFVFVCLKKHLSE